MWEQKTCGCFVVLSSLDEYIAQVQTSSYRTFVYYPNSILYLRRDFTNSGVHGGVQDRARWTGEEKEIGISHLWCLACFLLTTCDHSCIYFGLLPKKALPELL